MSFSSEVKDDLSRVLSSKPCCRKAEFVGFFVINGTIRISNGVSLVMHSEHSAAIRKMFTLSREFGLERSLSTYKRDKLKKNQVYQLLLPPQAQIDSFLADIGMLQEGSWQYDFLPLMQQRFLQDSCCCRAYLRGAFLAAGSLTDPAKGHYHLEIDNLDPKQANLLIELLSGFDLEAKITRRKGKETLYLKGAEQISDFMNIAGSHRSMLEFESVRVTKEVRNRANRLRNCDTANINKTINAAGRQIDDIQLIERSIGLPALPDKLRIAAELRLENPEASLLELSELSLLGRSALNHRLRRLGQIAENIRDFGAAEWDRQ